MKFNLKSPQPIPDIDYTLRVGNVYPSKNTRKTKYWVVIGLDDNSVYLLGINSNGEISQTATYGRHVFDNSCALFKRGDDLVGICSVAEIEFDIEWI